MTGEGFITAGKTQVVLGINLVLPLSLCMVLVYILLPQGISIDDQSNTEQLVHLEFLKGLRQKVRAKRKDEEEGLS